MSQVMEIKRWTARRKSALVLEIIQGQDDGGRGQSAIRSMTLPDIESWVDEGKHGMMRANPEDVREQY